MTDLVYKPSTWGSVYHASTADEVLGAGAAGPGKSTVLLMDPLQQIITEHQRCSDEKHPYPLQWGQSVGWALHLRREFPMLEQQIVNAQRVFPKIDPQVKWDPQKHTFKFRSGYHYQFGHCRNPNDWMGYHSNEYTHIGFDELNQFEQDQYDHITSRCRTSDPVLRTMLKVRSMSNPVMRRDGNFTTIISNPFWVRDRFVKPAREGKRLIKQKIIRIDGSIDYRTRLYLPATLYDNPNPQFVKDYEATLLGKPSHIREAMLYGNWFTTIGSYYGEEWNEAMHVCRPFRIPDHWKRFRSLDWGFKQPGCCLWWAMDDDEVLYCEREYTFQNKDVIDVAKRIRQIEIDAKLWHNGRSTITGPADTQLWEQRGDRVKTKAATMAEHGVAWSQADKRSRSRASQLLLSRIADHGGKTKTPGFVVFENCRMLRDTLPTIMSEPGDPETPQDGGDDHWHDAALYACSFASHGKKGLPARKNYDDTVDEDADDGFANIGRQTINRGRYGYGSGAN